MVSISERKLPSLYFSDQKELVVDILILATGVKPDIELAEKAGIQIDELGRVVVNKKMETYI